jgi:hypothetical protein
MSLWCSLIVLSSRLVFSHGGSPGSAGSGTLLPGNHARKTTHQDPDYERDSYAQHSPRFKGNRYNAKHKTKQDPHCRNTPYPDYAGEIILPGNHARKTTHQDLDYADENTQSTYTKIWTRSRGNRYNAKHKTQQDPDCRNTPYPDYAGEIVLTGTMQGKLCIRIRIMRTRTHSQHAPRFTDMRR